MSGPAGSRQHLSRPDQRTLVPSVSVYCPHIVLHTEPLSTSATRVSAVPTSPDVAARPQVRHTAVCLALPTFDFALLLAAMQCGNRLTCTLYLLTDAPLCNVVPSSSARPARNCLGYRQPRGIGRCGGIRYGGSQQRWFTGY